MSAYRNLLNKVKLLAAQFWPSSPQGPTPAPTASTKEQTKTEDPPNPKEAESKEVKWVGPYTQHLRKRRNNILFPESRRHISAQEWEDAVLYDAPRIQNHRDKFVALMAERLIGTGRFSPESIKGKTDNQVFLHFYESLKQFDALIQEYVFLQGTSPVEADDSGSTPDWDHEKDSFLRECYASMRNELEEKMRQTTLQYFNDDAIRAFAQSRETTHKTSFETSHFHQIKINNCHFMKDVDFYPRLFSESDRTLKDYIQFCMQSDTGEALIKEIKINFIICFERCNKIMAQEHQPMGNDEPAGGQILRNMRYLTGLRRKGQILELLNEDGAYSIPYSEIEGVLKTYGFIKS